MEKLSNSKKLQNFLIENLEKCDIQGRDGSDRLKFPDFELFPFNYLEYAEAELDNLEGNDNQKINCVSHIKRAIECELDSFLYALGLSKFIKPDNFPTKIEWIEGMGIFTPHSLRKLNAIRNEMEHEYSIPKIENIEIYFELASAFIHTLEGYLIIANDNQGVWWQIEEESKIFAFDMNYETKKAVLTFKIGENSSLVFEPSNKNEFLFGMQSYFLLSRFASDLIADSYVIRKISKMSAPSSFKQ